MGLHKRNVDLTLISPSLDHVSETPLTCKDETHSNHDSKQDEENIANIELPVAHHQYQIKESEQI